jgi:hypothetical protein
MPLGGKKKKPEDALGTLSLQDEVIRGLLDDWEGAVEGVDESREDNVMRRWFAGCAVKLLLQHMAVREEAARQVRRRLVALGFIDLAAQLEGNGPLRRQRIRELDELVRFRQAITLNRPEVQRTALALGRLARTATDGDAQLIPRIEQVLGPAGSRSLPSDLSVRLRSTTHPAVRGK